MGLNVASITTASPYTSNKGTTTPLSGGYRRCSSGDEIHVDSGTYFEKREREQAVDPARHRDAVVDQWEAEARSRSVARWNYT